MIYTLQFFNVVIKNKQLNGCLTGDEVSEILHEHTFAMMLSSHNDHFLWSEDPIEFVRRKFDTFSTTEIQAIAAQLVKSILN